ncbi:hypothetical protein BDU57DRAFT_530675 [Ampelomyces quisqualis]|uniref:Uncharacterized protein n=1 Tax=Ampelomyces quisqualis TaxID=50730 RepID=A0A6A5QEY8_AMPQU|nr:hypothetical protein BDU57DRAFT_530675 [Ampelomyces quisqualis]
MSFHNLKKGENQSGAHDITETHTYPFRKPGTLIVGKDGMQKALLELYGPNFAGKVHEPKFLNIRTAKTMAKTHHCGGTTNGDHAMVRSCFTKGEQAYCTEWVDVGNYRTRCGQRLGMWSQGCGNPHHKMMQPGSLSKIILEMFEGKRTEVDWAKFNDPRAMDVWHAEQDQAVVDPREIERQREEAIEEQIGGNNAQVQHDPKLYAIYEIYEYKKAEDEKKTRIEAAFAKQVDEQTIGTLDPKIVRLKHTKPAVYEKAYTDHRAKVMEELRTGPSREPAIPKNPRLEALATKRANGGKAMKTKNASHRGWSRDVFKGKKTHGHDTENHPPV